MSSLDPYRGAAARAAARNKIPKALFTNLINHESNWNPAAISGAGAIGLTQLMPATAASLKVNPHDPLANLDGGARYLRAQYDRFGSWKLALAAYNAGPGNVESGAWQHIPETAHYVSSILSGVSPHAISSSKTAAPSSLPRTVPFASSNPGFWDDPLAQSAFQSLGKIAQGYTPTATLSDLLAAQSTPSAPSAPIPPPTPLPPVRKPGKHSFSPTGKPVPTRDLTSVGGEHPTAGLAGYPAHDYMAPAGSPAIAPVSGRVVRLSGHDPANGPTEGPHGPFGWSIYIQGNDGHEYYLTHLGSRGVKVGQEVKGGQQIGTVGNYARFGGANHIHMGVH